MIFQYRATSIYYETFGKGPAIVLLHGFLESSNMWRPLLPRLSEINTVLILDLPGHGKSGIIAETHSMELMAEIVDALLKNLKIESAIFVGHSMGGYVALAFAEIFNEKVEKLVLLNSTPAADSQEKKRMRTRALKVMDYNGEAYINMAIGNLFTEAVSEKLFSEIENLKKEAYSFPTEGIKAAIKGMRDRKDRTAILKNFNREKYLVLGKDDPLLPLIETQQLAKYCDCNLKIVSGGHMSVVENKAIVMEYLLFIV